MSHLFPFCINRIAGDLVQRGDLPGFAEHAGDIDRP
jgi:hypothetical protein